MFLWTTVVEIDTVKCVFPVIISISYGNLNTDQNASFSAKSLIFSHHQNKPYDWHWHTVKGRGGREEEERREGGRRRNDTVGEKTIKRQEKGVCVHHCVFSNFRFGLVELHVAVKTSQLLLS